MAGVWLVYWLVNMTCLVCMQVVNVVSSYGLPWQNSFAIIVLLYFYSHYLFASGAAHIGAMYTAFLSVAIACGTPGLLAAVALGQVRPLASL